MTGAEIIDWAVKKCAHEKVPPTDSAIVRMIRYHLIDVNDAAYRNHRSTQKSDGTLPGATGEEK